MKPQILVNPKKVLLVLDELSDDFLKELASRFQISQSRAVRIAIQYAFYTSRYFESYLKPSIKIKAIPGIPKEQGESDEDYLNKLIKIAQLPIFNIKEYL